MTFTITNSCKTLSAKIDEAGGRLRDFSNLADPHQTILRRAGAQYGSTVWPSPQLDWGWPPPPILDSQAYDLLEQTESRLSITSAICPATSWQIEKCFTLLDAALDLTYVLKSHHEEARTAALWEVSRHEGFPVLFVADSINVEGELLPGSFFSDSRGHHLYRYHSQLIQQQGHAAHGHKLFAHGGEGWIVQLRPDIVFLKNFRPVDKAYAVSGEAGIEIYGNGDPNDAYIEIEQQTRGHRILPGESISMSNQWRLISDERVDRLYKQAAALTTEEQLVSLVQEIRRLTCMS